MGSTGSAAPGTEMEGAQSMSERVEWEYTQVGCEVWHVQHLCNGFAAQGWEPVTVFDARSDSKEVVVLFRRPSNREAPDA
jgi:hypothetical protein